MPVDEHGSNDIRSPKEIETRWTETQKRKYRVPTTLDLQRRLKQHQKYSLTFTSSSSNDIRSPKEIETEKRTAIQLHEDSESSNDIRSPKEIETVVTRKLLT